MVYAERFLFWHGILDSCWRVSVSGKVLAVKGRASVSSVRG